MKPRNILIILILNYLLIVLASVFGEFIFIGTRSKNMQLMMRTAADMALEQVQVSDDFFRPGEGYMLDSVGNKTDAFSISVPNSSGTYSQVGAYQVITEEEGKKEIFNKLYNGKISQYIAEVPKVVDIETSIGYWQEGYTSMQWYKIPKIGVMGYDITGDAAKQGFKGNSVASSEELNGIWKAYEFDKSEKTAYLDGAVESYFMTPISLGITYIDKELLQFFYMNNMDLLMRGKYAKNGWNLNTEQGGDGILQGVTLREFVSNGLDAHNPINNGEFTLLRGNRVTKKGIYEFYEGHMPEIRYKVIDMYAPENDDVLKMLYGYEGSKLKDGSKARYLKEQDNETDPATGQRPQSKPIVIAEVTFFADIVVPYSTIPIREMRATSSTTGELGAMRVMGLSDVGPQAGNYIDLIRTADKGSGVPSEMDNPSDVMMYRRIFAIAP